MPAVAAAAMAGGMTAAAAVASLALLRRRRSREETRQGSFAQEEEHRGLGARDADALLQEVARRSKSILYVVSNKTNDSFSIPNLTKYLRMKSVAVHQGATPEETILVNAERLLELLDRAGGSAPRSPSPLRHELVGGVISPQEMQDIFPAMQAAYVQQPLDYGRNSRYGDKWRISCYVVVMDNWKPRIEPHEPMVRCMTPVVDACIKAFSEWHCRLRSLASVDVSVMNAFVTRYRPIHEEDQLKKHIDGANVDGSVVLALPTDDPFDGGALHVWDGKPQHEFVYRMRPGDALFLENAVWHQAKPISSGTRWALVLFLRLRHEVLPGKATAA